MARVVIYSTSYCGYCRSAESLLRARDIPFDRIDVTSDPARRKWLVQATGRWTVPQIFIDDRPIGGYTDLAALGDRGMLLTNPPYGQRVSGGADLRGLYARLGDVLRSGGRGWQLGMLVPPDRALAGQLGLALSPVLRTANGGLPVELLTTVRRPGHQGNRTQHTLRRPAG